MAMIAEIKVVLEFLDRPNELEDRGLGYDEEAKQIRDMLSELLKKIPLISPHVFLEAVYFEEEMRKELEKTAK